MAPITMAAFQSTLFREDTLDQFVGTPLLPEGSLIAGGMEQQSAHGGECACMVTRHLPGVAHADVHARPTRQRRADARGLSHEEVQRRCRLPAVPSRRAHLLANTRKHSARARVKTTVVCFLFTTK